MQTCLEDPSAITDVEAQSREYLPVTLNPDLHDKYSPTFIEAQTAGSTERAFEAVQSLARK